MSENKIMPCNINYVVFNRQTNTDKNWHGPNNRGWLTSKLWLQSRIKSPKILFEKGKKTDKFEADDTQRFWIFLSRSERFSAKIYADDLTTSTSRLANFSSVKAFCWHRKMKYKHHLQCFFSLHTIHPPLIMKFFEFN